MPNIIIVDKNDQIIGVKPRNELTSQDIYRVSALWVTNSKNEILLAKRHHTKTHHPNMWGPAVSGTVDEGETYLENIIKETEEELGLKNIQPQPGPKTETNNEYHHFTQWYTLSINKPAAEFKIPKNEVAEIKWFSPDELEKKLRETPEKFLPNLKKYFELFSK